MHYVTVRFRFEHFNQQNDQYGCDCDYSALSLDLFLYYSSERGDSISLFVFSLSELL